MGGPYLESGESIVMTTDRVSVDSIAYDAILTTRRLILMDRRYTRFEPRILPLSTIESVRSGKAATGEPVIILALQNLENDATGNMIIIFSQEPLENRRQDRDLWVQKFIENSLSDREENSQKDAIPARKPEGMHPSTRRWVAPEIIRPHSEKIRVEETVPDVEITPEEAGPAQNATVKPEPADRSLKGEDREPGESGGYGFQDHLTRATRTAVQSIRAHEPPVALQPQESERKETDMPEPSSISPAEEVPEAAGPLPETPSRLSVSILAAVRSLTARTEQEVETSRVPVQADIRMTSPLPELPISRTGPEPVVERVPPFTPAQPGMRELNLHEEVPGSVRNTSLLPETAVPAPAQEEPPESPPAEVPKEPEAADMRPAEPEIQPEPVIKDSAREPHADTRGPSLRPAGAPDTPRLPGMRPILIAGGAVLCLLLVIAGIILLPGILPQDHGPVSPHTTPVPTPASPLIPAPSPVTYQQDGVWVRIVSTGYFEGQAGNPGAMKQVSGSGEKIYKVRNSTDLVKVSAEKQDYSGGELLVEIYRNGKMIGSRSVTAPMGSVELLLDPVTEKPPGLITTAPTGNTTRAGIGQSEYY